MKAACQAIGLQVQMKESVWCGGKASPQGLAGRSDPGDLYPWQDEVLLTESNHVSFVYEENECSLVVLSAGTEDGGVYTCTARNLAGEVSCKAELSVHSGALVFGGEGAGSTLPFISYTTPSSQPPTEYRTLPVAF